MELEKDVTLLCPDILEWRLTTTQPRTLIHRAINLCESKELDDELNHLRTILSCNEYSSRDIEQAIKRRSIPREKEEFVATTYLQHEKNCIDRIGGFSKMEHQHRIHYHEEEDSGF
ncbi:hypothetical protein NQ315_015174 [Exocentrus adspersus]|uniref:Helix-turn-helix domain-containing protein n=1 Tax=Exocentrus adspersus TaxID=1586481 RepID=A0AAV8VBV7_9CUCU|nr:hypothetical protein NQ315_015174 [Exocentrus adspersus]